MVKHDENSNSSSDASTTSSFSSSSKSRKQATKSLIKTNKNINLSAGTNNLCKSEVSQNSPSLSQSSPQQLIYNNQANSLFKLNPLSSSNNFNSQQAIHLATMKSVANQLAVANSTSASNTPSTLSAINDQVSSVSK